MCRILGYVAAAPTSLREILGADGLDAFTALSAQHRDGWGMAWAQPDGTIAVEKASDPADRSDRWRALAETRLSDTGVVHLRWATPPLEVTGVNNHPFVRDGMAFAHNGRVLPVAGVEELVPEALKADLDGTTDSERAFAVIRSRTAESGDIISGLRSAARDLIAGFTCTSLNCTLLTASTLYAVSCYDEALRPLPDEPEHFALRWRRSREAVVVASTGWAQDDWRVVPNGHALVIDRETRDTQIVRIADPPTGIGPAGVSRESACT